MGILAPVRGKRIPNIYRSLRALRAPTLQKNRQNPKGDGTENVINCRKLSQIVVTFYDEFTTIYDIL